MFPNRKRRTFYVTRVELPHALLWIYGRQSCERPRWRFASGDLTQGRADYVRHLLLPGKFLQAEEVVPEAASTSSGVSDGLLRTHQAGCSASTVASCLAVVSTRRRWSLAVWMTCAATALLASTKRLRSGHSSCM